MVKLIKKFEFLYPIAEKSETGAIQWEPRTLLLKGTASVKSTGPSPIYAGFYRLEIENGRLPVEISFSSITDTQNPHEDLLPALLQPEYQAIFQGLIELTRQHFNGQLF